MTVLGDFLGQWGMSSCSLSKSPPCRVSFFPFIGGMLAGEQSHNETPALVSVLGQSANRVGLSQQYQLGLLHLESRLILPESFSDVPWHRGVTYQFASPSQQRQPQFRLTNWYIQGDYLPRVSMKEISLLTDSSPNCCISYSLVLCFSKREVKNLPQFCHQELWLLEDQLWVRINWRLNSRKWLTETMRRHCRNCYISGSHTTWTCVTGGRWLSARPDRLCPPPPHTRRDLFLQKCLTSNLQRMGGRHAQQNFRKYKVCWGDQPERTNNKWGDGMVPHTIPPLGNSTPPLGKERIQVYI